MPGVILRLQNQENYLKQRYAKYMPEVILWLQIKATILGKDMPNICQRYTNNMLGGIQMLQIQDNYLKQRYVKDMNTNTMNWATNFFFPQKFDLINSFLKLGHSSFFNVSCA